MSYADLSCQRRKILTRKEHFEPIARQMDWTSGFCGPVAQRKRKGKQPGGVQPKVEGGTRKLSPVSAEKDNTNT